MRGQVVENYDRNHEIESKRCGMWSKPGPSRRKLHPSSHTISTRRQRWQLMLTQNRSTVRAEVSGSVCTAQALIVALNVKQQSLQRSCFNRGGERRRGALIVMEQLLEKYMQ